MLGAQRKGQPEHKGSINCEIREATWNGGHRDQQRRDVKEEEERQQYLAQARSRDQERINNTIIVKISYNVIATGSACRDNNLTRVCQLPGAPWQPK